MYYQRPYILRSLAALLAVASALSSLRADGDSATTPPASAPPTGKAVDLGNVEVHGSSGDEKLLPVGPTSSLYGYEQSLQETPRSIYQISKSQLDEDPIQNYNDFTRYSPSVQKASSSPFSTFANIRGGSADTMRNGILLLNPAVRPFDKNSWDTADIVAGVPSVAFGSTTRTAGYINYITKQPYFDKQRSEVNVGIGRLGASSSTSYGQYSLQLDTGGPLVADKLAYRFSIQDSQADTYWGNSRADFLDVFGAISWKPTEKLRVDANFTYTRSDGSYPYGINRLTQNLVDNWVYTAGAASPILKYGSSYYRANSAGTYDAGTIVNGLFTPNGNTTAATWSAGSPATLVGWVELPENARNVNIKGNQTLYNQNGFSYAHEYIAQVLSTLALNDTFTIRNNSIYQNSDSYVFGYDQYHSYMVNHLISSRFEFITNHTFKLFGSDLVHKSNSGLDFRYLWNLCDNVGKPSERPISAADATDAGTLGTGYLLGVASLYPNPLSSSSSLYNAELTKYGWLAIAPGYVNSTGRAQGLAVASLGGTDLRVNQLNTLSLYSEHNLDLGEHLSWRGGVRATRIWDYLRATPITYTVADQGFLPNTRLSDAANTWNGDFNTSLTYRPIKPISIYTTYDNDRASADCGCCLTQGFVGPNQTIERTYFHVVSQLFEVGSKQEIIPNKWFTSVSAFRQTRQVPSIPTASNPNPAEVKLRFKGIEISTTYQASKNFTLGANYAYLDSLILNQTASGVYSSDYNGYVADGQTLVNNATSSIGVGAATRTNYRALAIPLASANGWLSYQFDNGFGIKLSTWLTSPWQATRLVTVHAQHDVDVGLFYAAKTWRADLSFLNITNEKNWAPGGTYAGGTVSYLLPYDRFGVTGRISYRF